MNILEFLNNAVVLAKGRDYFTGAEIAQETVDKVKTDGFSVFEVVKQRYDIKRIFVG